MQGWRCIVRLKETIGSCLTVKNRKGKRTLLNSLTNTSARKDDRSNFYQSFWVSFWFCGKVIAQNYTNHRTNA
jgi:hypothetical protein